jgi:hypothetical protein
MRKSLVVILMLLFAVCGCVKQQNGSVVGQIDVIRSDHNFYIVGAQGSGPLLSVDDSFTFDGKIDVSKSFKSYRFSHGDSSIDVYDAFVIRDKMYNHGERGFVKKFNGYTIKNIDSGPHSPNGTYYVDVVDKTAFGTISYTRFHSDAVQGGYFSFLYSYVEPLGPSHRSKLWPNNVPDGDAYLQKFIERAQAAVRVLPKD